MSDPEEQAIEANDDPVDASAQIKKLPKDFSLQDVSDALEAMEAQNAKHFAAMAGLRVELEVRTNKFAENIEKISFNFRKIKEHDKNFNVKDREIM